MNGPASTGGGSNVETISLLTATLCNLAALHTITPDSKPPQSQLSNGLQETSESKSSEEADSDAEQQYLTTLAQVTKGFSDRCVSFQSGLLFVAEGPCKNKLPS